MSYRHISAEDRSSISTLLSEGCSYSHIACRLGVHRSSISREITRNGVKPKPKRKTRTKVSTILSIDGRKFRGSGFTKLKYEAQAIYTKQLAAASKKNSYYTNSAANKKAKKRRRQANQQRIKVVHGSSSFVEKYILKNLIRDQWSPEQIANRLLKDYCIKISYRTVYEYIYNSGDKKKLVKHLRHHGDKYRRLRGAAARTKNNRNLLPQIHDREAVIESRTRLGDYEGDTIVGLDKKDRLLTHVDRASGECSIRLVLNYDAQKIAHKTISVVKSAQQYIHTITYDRGNEFAGYEMIQNHTGSKIYFADAYSSYQRGSNENLNGLIRQYYPKRYDFKNIKHKEIDELEEKLNNRPRKRYNYRTPIEQRQHLLSYSNVALRD